jgi:hypothetical protein
MNIFRTLFCIFCSIFSTLLICSCQTAQPLKTAQAVKTARIAETAQPLKIAEQVAVSIEVLQTKEEMNMLGTVLTYQYPTLYVYNKDSNHPITLQDVNITAIVYYQNAEVKEFKGFWALLSYDSKRELSLGSTLSEVEKCIVIGTAKDVQNKAYEFKAVWRKE